MSTYFIAPDAHNDLTVWRQTDRDPVAVLARAHVADPHLWDLIVAAVAS